MSGTASIRALNRPPVSSPSSSSAAPRRAPRPLARRDAAAAGPAVLATVQAQPEPWGGQAPRRPSVAIEAVAAPPYAPSQVERTTCGSRDSAPLAGDAPEVEFGGGGNGGSGGGGANGGSGCGGDGDGAEGEDDDSALLSLSEAEDIVAAKGLKLPADFAAAAQNGGLRSTALNKWVDLQAVGLYALLSRLPFIRDRLIADGRYPFKVMAEVTVDSFCMTVAEVRKRGDNFWDEFEFYVSDVMVGLALDVFIITFLTPMAVIGARPKSASASGLRKLTAGLPSACFERSIPGVREYSVAQRFGCFGLKMVQYGGAGALCGFLGQAAVNQLTALKRSVSHPEDIENAPKLPPVGLTALSWGVFMAGSSNLRYQTVFALERLVDLSPVGRCQPLANALSIGMRYTNNVTGGENFIEHARFFGCQ